MKTTILLISSLAFFIFFIYKCYSQKIKISHDNDNLKIYIESFIDFQILDSDGNNLLSPEYNYRDKIDILTYNRKGKVIIYNDPTKMASKGYLVDKNDYSIRLYLSLLRNDSNISETLLRFDNKEVFIFKTEFEIHKDSSNFEIKGSSYQRKKIWLNDTLFWDRNSNDNSYPELIINKDQL